MAVAIKRIIASANHVPRAKRPKAESNTKPRATTDPMTMIVRRKEKSALVMKTDKVRPTTKAPVREQAGTRICDIWPPVEPCTIAKSGTNMRACRRT